MPQSCVRFSGEVSNRPHALVEKRPQRPVMSRQPKSQPASSRTTARRTTSSGSTSRRSGPARCREGETRDPAPSRGAPAGSARGEKAKAGFALIKQDCIYREPDVLLSPSTASEALRSPDRLDRVHLVGFGDRRKAEDLPRLLTESVAGEVVLVQPRCVMMTIAPQHLSLSVRRSGTESS